MNAEPDRTRTLVEYGDAEQAAMTVHFRSDNEYRLFGTPGFIYYPTIEWQVCDAHAAAESKVECHVRREHSRNHDLSTT